MRKFLYLLIIILFLVFMYAKYIEPFSLVIKEYSVESNKLPENFDGLKIVHLSDFLYSSESQIKHIENVIKETNELNADIVVFTGDLISKKISDKDISELTRLLSAIKVNLYKYAIVGDKDTNQSKKILESSGFILLDNTSEYLFKDGTQPILIAGGDNLTEETLLKDDNISYEFKLALIHKPDYFDSIKDTYDLVLAGHSLGGEVRIPYVGPVFKQDGSKKYTDRFYADKNSQLFISFGTGNNKTNLRLFNKPVINVYRLVRK